MPLRRRKVAAHLVVPRADEVREGSVGEARLCPGGSRCENAPTALSRTLERLAPDRSLADARLTVEHERNVGTLRLVQKSLDGSSSASRPTSPPATAPPRPRGSIVRRWIRQLAPARCFVGQFSRVVLCCSSPGRPLLPASTFVQSMEKSCKWNSRFRVGNLGESRSPKPVSTLTSSPHPRDSMVRRRSPVRARKRASKSACIPLLCFSSAPRQLRLPRPQRPKLGSVLAACVASTQRQDREAAPANPGGISTAPGMTCHLTMSR